MLDRNYNRGTGMSQQQTCKKCKRAQRFEYSLSNDIWQMLPKKWHNKCLCIECFIKEMDEILLKDGWFSSDEFKFMAIVGDKLHCVIQKGR